ncbi:host cell division inhibitor Icd-like protein [Morganella sp. GD04133]|uniref:host cell division inhibitor Icd-like protein n=1 Tax=Morganella sp. GD04133 TaxID=2975435 RepID=UPI00244BD597|nr:host cell division inhibitor Icd-like protein [Morganella sp. GD04133]MDH0354021.1 host cell division inhibitor Icd-like protein [Morganella sp. GD04133]
MMATQTTNSGLDPNPLKTLQTPNMRSAQKVIRTNLSSYSQKKKDSVQAVLIQFYTDLPSLRGKVSRIPNSIGSVQRLPDDIGLVHVAPVAVGGMDIHKANDIGSVPVILFANGANGLNHWNDIHSVKFWAELLAKVSAGLSGETLSYPNPDIPNRGEIEFCESIKKGGVSTTLCVFDIKYRANQPLQGSQWLKAGKQNISGEVKNFDDHHLFLSPDVRYSDPALAKSGVRIETLNIQTATHDAPSVFFCVRAYAHLQNTVLCRPDSMVALAGQPKGWLVSVCASSLNPVSVTTPIEIETSGGDSALIQTEIIVMMAIPAQTHPKFKWRFFSCQQSRYFTVEARSEQEVRSMLPDSPCLFSARIRQGVNHA